MEDEICLILPGTLEYALALQEIPPVPTWRAMADRTNGEMALIAPVGGNGLLEAVSLDRFYEYCNDGELDARQAEMEELDEQMEGVILCPG